MGFNNHGVDRLVDNIRQSKYSGILGVSISKNSDTPIENAVEDYLISLEKVYDHAGYIALNISSPGTADLRQLQEKKYLPRLLAALKSKQNELSNINGKYVPLAVKLAPDLTPDEIKEMAEIIIEHDIDGVIATNSTLSREGVEGLPDGTESGGLSGAPLRHKAYRALKLMHRALHGKVPIIASGGIMTAADAVERLEAGASLVQLYSGLIYHGPGLITEIISKLDPDNFYSFKE